jgi:hypothetical protein
MRDIRKLVARQLFVDKTQSASHMVIGGKCERELFAAASTSWT